MNKRIALLLTLLIGTSTCVQAKQSHSPSPLAPKHIGFVMKTKRGGNITTKKSGRIVKIRSKNFLR